MEKRVALEKRGLPDDQITELILDNCRSTNIEGLTDSFTALEVLSLINVGLTSLKNFPKLPALRKLELSDNRISNGVSHLAGSPKLTHLNLSGNRIKDFDELKPLKELENLEVLDLFNNEVTATENYRDKIFELIPSLKYLDGFDREDTEAPSDEEDEANGGGDDDDEAACFSINGIDIDLDELERFEARLRQKRAVVEEAVNGLESRLGQLELRLDADEEEQEDKSEAHAADDRDDLDELYEEIQRKNESESAVARSENPPSLGALLVAFLSLLAFLNQICFVQRNQQLMENVELDDSSDYDEEDDNDISLADVYNDNLEEDGSDWNEEDGEGDDDVDEPTDDEEHDGEGDSDGEAAGGEGAEEKASSDAEGADAEARGKKRKLDGNDG
ncbi:acidic leucine-rich nuclear phosphoprotein 32 family member A isoform X2 [Culex quinquefasciatus]|uniref:acidic leucine-rich nuclear phosphoprotein 32 family member A isoform X2 n=1 Tax=Culex quinquefasciatus TaxID=7176 RepID=UPI0018E34840|nr:acidic leucine-rich nuclear phosphoprotein 32 family member A isoform X2 [Culex quinquefasciatus]XP_039435376.1 acidic leucine-rich nuclear phosphoprotein 32 family member A isoform X1 [Culex pipiens pallens]